MKELAGLRSSGRISVVQRGMPISKRTLRGVSPHNRSSRIKMSAPLLEKSARKKRTLKGGKVLAKHPRPLGGGSVGIAATSSGRRKGRSDDGIARLNYPAKKKESEVRGLLGGGGRGVRDIEGERLAPEY